ncbi:MAG: pyruvate kinase [Gammaproteobacteria bacterium]|nr:pyruvate kinase [Gammaproteobacteria bacterium]
MRTLDDCDIHQKIMTLRVDLNVPLEDGVILNDRRIQAILPTLRYALAKKAGIILLSHLGRPEAGSTGVADPRYSLAPIADYLAQALQQPVPLIQDWVSGVQVIPGSVVLCENVRFEKGDMQNDALLAKRIAALSDIFVMDAFAVAHRAQASTVGAIHYAPIAVAGPLLMAELQALDKVFKYPARPVIAIMGGAKISEKLAILKNLINKVDILIIGGAMANTFLAALGRDVGQSLYEPNQCATALSLLQKAKDCGVNLLLPEDVVIESGKILDVGLRTRQAIKRVIGKAGTIIWNGPMGLFEQAPFNGGTESVAQSIAASKAFSVAGGGETLAAIDQAHVGDCFDHLSTGGGAFLAYLSCEPLAAVVALEDACRGRSQCRPCSEPPHLKRPCSEKPTTIIATLGPSTDKPGVLQAMLVAGVDVIRLNLSHGTYAQHQARVDLARAIALELGKSLGIMADLQGPKIRIGSFTTGSIQLKVNDPFVIDAQLSLAQGTAQAVGLHYPNLCKDLKPGDQLLLDDGFIVLVVDKIIGTAVHCIVQQGGKLSDNKGINRRGGGISAEALTPKDRKDIDFAAKLKVDFVALSFARCAADVQETRALLQKAGSHALVVAKIERVEALEALEEIILASDEVMVARGDLGVECGYAALPGIQKHIIARARALGRPVITATQMMESMVHRAIPTRAEVSDVANAVLDGTTAVMLSAETAVGDFPAQTVQMMREICTAAERI